MSGPSHHVITRGGSPYDRSDVRHQFIVVWTGESCEHTMYIMIGTIIALTGNRNIVLTCRVLGNCGPKVFAYRYKNMSLRDF